MRKLNVSLTLPPELVQAVKQWGEINNRHSFSEMVRVLLEQALKKQ